MTSRDKPWRLIVPVVMAFIIYALALVSMVAASMWLAENHHLPSKGGTK